VGAKLEQSGIDVSVPVFVSCYMFEAAKIMKRAKSGDDIQVLFEDTGDVFQSLKEFDSYMGNSVTAEKVLRYFGTRPHYDKIVRGTTSGLWLPKNPPALMPFLHLVLPIQGCIYKNGSMDIEFQNTVSYGVQRGPLVTHLGVVFAANVEHSVLDELLMEQAVTFESEMKSLANISSFDFSSFEEHFALLERGIKRFGL
jgi:hypothetical protein